MPQHVYTSGEVLTATNLNRSVNPVFVRKTGSETVNNSLTLQDDDQLFVTLASNTSYYFLAMIVYQSTSSTPDLRLAWSFPGDATLNWAPYGLTLTDADQNTSFQSGYIRVTSGSGATNVGVGTQAGNELITVAKGVISMGATAGNLQLQWAQVVATAENTQIKANSFIFAQIII